ncbi:DUF349 domain-containing protein [Pseudoalteromonas ulvae]|uniref:DUF349 domain-containing protein n=1 Tax=Pseudoalteromonas ulvae TaxID=107327 RepID=A0A244CN01_PSEDV|nr:DUF349 domain-containing protein [Pseudoalteromonas ulvae]OUL57007.1 hypothetical protein B1199_16735 [Pseudoalteromonas ulvae]
MIFKTLFTPKWKHPKLAIRLGALEKLDCKQSKDHDILNQLAFSDEAVEVRKKALTKLNNMTSWWQAFKQEQEQSIKELAEKQIMSAVLNADQSLPAEHRIDYIDRCNKNTVLEKLALNDQDDLLRLKLLKRLAKPSLIETAFQQANEQFQVKLLDLIEQYQLIKSVKNKAKPAALKLIEEKVAEAKLAKEMPVKITKEVTLILAKLNALRDKNDYLQVKDEAIALYEQWNQLELVWLDNESKEQFKNKFRTLEQKLEKKITTLGEAYHLAEQKAAELREIAAQQQVLAQALSQFEDKMSTVLDDLLSHNVSALNDMARHTEALLKMTPQVDAQSQTRFEQLAAILAELPETMATLEAFNQQLAKFSTVEIPNDVAQYDDATLAYQSWHKQSKVLLKQLPRTFNASAKKQLKMLEQQWHTAIEPLKGPLELSKNQCHKKLKDLRRLINQGRFNVAFGVFKGMHEIYQTLTPNYQQQLEKDYQHVADELSKAKDWQEYVGAPKREALIEELKLLVQTACHDPKVRAEEVKTFRRQWNDLGKIVSDQDKQNAEIFNQLVESAFTPCREFFAEQEKERSVNFAARQAIIDKLQALTVEIEQPEFDIKHVESQFNKLLKQWRTAGSVDAKAYKNLLDAYKSAERPISTAIRTMHRSNAELKAQVVSQAKLLSESEDVFAACQEIKSLQQKWKTLGFAGNKQEPELWQKFRQYNDALFARRDESKAQHDQQVAKQSAELERELETLINVFESKVNDKGSLLELTDTLNLLQQRIDTQDKPLQGKVKQLLAAVNQAISTIDEQQLNANYDQLFAALEHGTAIPQHWQTSQPSSLTREQVFVRMEILSQVAEPKGDPAIRMTEQVALLAEKMSGEDTQLDALLVLWVNCGPLTDDDKHQLAFIKPLYIQ